MTDPMTGRAGRLAYELHGRANPGMPILLLRPLGGSMSLWGRFREILAERRQIISFDFRGTGRSDPERAWINTRSLARDALGLLEHLEVPRADVFGLSLGGMTATWLARMAPARVSRLCLASTPARGLEITRAGIARELRLAACFTHPREDVEPTLVRRILSSRFRETRPDEVRRIEAILRADPASRRSLLRHALAGLLHDARRELKGIQAPTLVLAGELDGLLGVEPSRELAAAIPRARFEIVAAAGHDLTLERPEATAARVLSFFEARSCAIVRRAARVG